MENAGSVRRYDIVGVGEALLDFSETRTDDTSKIALDGFFGGAVPNCMSAVAKLGRSTTFIGKVGKDAFGDFFVRRLSENGVDSSFMVRGDELTTIATVALDASGERSFAFYRKHTADLSLREDEVDMPTIKACRIFHFGGVALTDDPSKSTNLFAARAAKAAGALISFDPNYRETLWAKLEDASDMIRSGLELADYAKLGAEEASLALYGTASEDIDAEEAALKLCKLHDLRFVSVTLGPKGAVAASGDTALASPSYDVKTIDTTGAGDAYWGAALHKLLEVPPETVLFSKSEMEDILRYAIVAGSLSTTKRGATEAQATDAEIKSALTPAR
jgi:fructokinase